MIKLRAEFGGFKSATRQTIQVPDRQNFSVSVRVDCGGDGCGGDGDGGGDGVGAYGDDSVGGCGFMACANNIELMSYSC